MRELYECKFCGEPFIRYFPNREYCSDGCHKEFLKGYRAEYKKLDPFHTRFGIKAEEYDKAIKNLREKNKAALKIKFVREEE